MIGVQPNARIETSQRRASATPVQGTSGALMLDPPHPDQEAKATTPMDDDVMIDPAAPPSGPGCVECLATDGWWFHLRRCAKCGRIGCCDSSPSQHARRHAAESGHRVATSFEPGEDWFYDFVAEDAVDGAPMTPPLHHPVDQPTPGPAGRVPPDWRFRLH
jgi:hypothetical protein